MKRPVWLLLCLIGLVAVLTPLAYASPPDPSWVRGVYDGDDFDDVVVLLMTEAGAVDPFPLGHIGPRWPVVEGTLEPGQQTLPAVTPSSNLTRGPPAL